MWFSNEQLGVITTSWKTTFFTSHWWFCNRNRCTLSWLTSTCWCSCSCNFSLRKTVCWSDCSYSLIVCYSFTDNHTIIIVEFYCRTCWCFYCHISWRTCFTWQVWSNFWCWCCFLFNFKSNCHFLWSLVIMSWVSDHYGFSMSTSLCSCWSLPVFPCKCCCTTIVIWEFWSSSFIGYIGSWISIKTSTNFCSVLFFDCNCLEFWTFIINEVICETSHDICSSTNNSCSLHTCNIVKWLRFIYDWCVKCNRPHNITKCIIIRCHRIQSLWTFCCLSRYRCFISFNCWIFCIFVKLSQTLCHFSASIGIHSTILTH